MIATVPYLEEKFDEFNGRFFGGQLPKVPLELSRARTYVGVCAYKTRRVLGIKTVRYDFRIRISTRFDLPEAELEDTLVHEMIHLRVWTSGLKDTSAHGKAFRAEMERINSEYGRHITISHKSTPAEREAALDQRPRWRVIAIVSLKDGREGVKVLPRVPRRIVDYNRALLRSGKVSRIDYYLEEDPFFGRFPCSSAFNVVFADMAAVREHLTAANPLSVSARGVGVG